MNIEQLNKLREQIEQDLTRILKVNPNRLATKEPKWLKCKFDDKKRLQYLLKKYPDAELYDWAVGKYGGYDHIGVTIKVYEVKPFTQVTKQLIKEKTMKAVANIIKKETQGLYNSYRPKCEVMELFKANKITWDDVIEAHKKDCGL